MSENFETKDSGKREEFASGMQRDTQEGKTQFRLALDGPLPEALFWGKPKADAAHAFMRWLDNQTVESGCEVVNLIANYEGGYPALFQRFAELMTRGAVKYTARNWMKANGEAELQRFIDSASRHFFQWFAGNRDEDHGAAVIFNINGAQYVRGRMEVEELMKDIRKPSY